MLFEDALVEVVFLRRPLLLALSLHATRERQLAVLETIVLLLRSERGPILDLL